MFRMFDLQKKNTNAILIDFLYYLKHLIKYKRTAQYCELDVPKNQT